MVKESLIQNPNTPGRDWSALDLLCDQYVKDIARLDPIAATEWGLPTDEGGLPDFSPDGMAEIEELGSELLTRISGIEPADQTDRITAAALRDRLGLESELFQTGERYAELNNLASPLQTIRDVFSLMPTETVEDWENIVSRIAAIPTALEGYKASLAKGSEMGMVAARRQIEIGIGQANKLADSSGYFSELVSACPSSIEAKLGAKTFGAAVRRAAEAYAGLARFLGEDLLPIAPDVDAVGRERYERFSAEFVGARVDLDETYEWGLEELARIDAAQLKIAENLYGSGTTLRQAFDRLEADPTRQVHGKDALKRWLQTTADMSIRELNGKEFDIPEPLLTIECMIAPTDEGGIWYTSPSSDFSRPGRMWWSIPEGDEVFHVWQERTTVFHEGVPGHHLQLGQAIYQEDTLNLWRRLACWNSGYGEGWALYAEQLMADLGFQDDPADMLGMLDAQRLRAARVVLDIGVHLQKPRPDGDGIWDADYAWEFLRSNVTGSDGMLRFELDRYLGWPGQAPSYKIGQRLWQQLADDYSVKHGNAPEVRRRFHTTALNLGSLPMGILREAVLAE